MNLVAFSFFDFNRNGSLTLAEVVLLLSSVSSGIQSFVNMNNSAPEPLSPIQLANDAFAYFDRDQNKMLQPEEFILWARAHRSLMLSIERLSMVGEISIDSSQKDFSKTEDTDSDIEHEIYESSGGVDMHLPEVYDSKFHPFMPCASQQREKSTNPSPNVNLELDWIYGTNGKACRDWCCFVLGGEVAYFISKYAIIYSPRTHTQRYYCGHRQDITCLRTNSSMEIIVTGDGALSGSHSPLISQIHVWDVATLQRLAIFRNGSLGRHVSLLSFCANYTTGNEGYQHGGHTIRAMNASHSARMNPVAKSVDNLVLAIGSGISSFLMLWDWKNQRILSSGRAGPVAKRVLACALSQDGFEAVTCGEQFVMFHELNANGRLNSYRPSNSSELHICVSVAYISPRNVVVGNCTGNLFHFHQSQLIKVVEAHSIRLSINICVVPYGSTILCTGGKDGHIKSWNAGLENVDDIDFHSILSTMDERVHRDDCRISSLSYDVARKQFLIGTRRGNMYLVEERESGISEAKTGSRLSLRQLVISHGSLRHVAAAWNASHFASCGGSEVYLWSLRQKVCKKKTRLVSPPSVLSFSSSGDILAIGGTDGTLALLSISEWRVRKKIKCCPELLAIRFSPRDESISVGGANGIIFVYAFSPKAFSLKKYTLLQPSEFPLMPVCAFDYSRDGRILRSLHGNTMSTACFCFWDLHRHRGSQLSASKNTDWTTHSVWVGNDRDKPCQKSSSTNVLSASCVNKHQTLSVHLDSLRGSLILSCFRKEIDITVPRQSMTKRIQSAHLRAKKSGDSVGIQGFVSFALIDRLLLSSGIADSTICQWKVISEPIDEQAAEDFEDSIPYNSELDCNEEVSQQQKRLSPFFAEVNNNFQDTPDVNIALTGAIGTTNFGNQSLACVDDLVISSTGTIVRVSSMFEQSKQHERYLFTPEAHQKTITNITVHPGGRYFATASRYDCRITIWDLQAFQSHLEIAPLKFRSSPRILSLRFDDNDGRIIAIVWKESDRSYHLGLYEWSIERCIVDTCIGQQAVHFLAACSFHSSYMKESGGSVSFVTGGFKHIKFWLLDRASEQLRCQNGIFGRYAIRNTALCALSMPPFLLTGMSDGSIVAWDRGVAACSYSQLDEICDKADGDMKHNVVNLHYCASLDIVISILRNGDINVWKCQVPCSDNRNTSQVWFHHFLAHLKTMNLFAISNPSPFDPFIMRSMNDTQLDQINASCNSEAQNGLLISLTSGQVIFIKHQLFLTAADQIESKKDAMLVWTESSRHDYEICFALHPKEEWIAVSGSPGIISIRSLDSINYTMRKSVISMIVDIKCLAWSMSGDVIAASMANGFVVFIDSITLKVLSSICVGDKLSTVDADLEQCPPRLVKWCQCLRFSPSDQFLALACRDYRLYLYSRTTSSSPVESTMHSNNHPMFELMFAFSGHKSRIVALDFTSNSSWLMSSSDSFAGEYLCWNILEPSRSFGNKSLLLSLQNTLHQEIKPNEFQTWSNTFTGPAEGFRGKQWQVSSLARSHACQYTDNIPDNDDAIGKNDENCPLKVFAVGRTDGKVLLTSCPFDRELSESAQPKFAENVYSCDAVITHVEFHASNNFLVTMGVDCQNRHTIIAWRTDLQPEAALFKHLPNMKKEEPAIAKKKLFSTNDAEVLRLRSISRIFHSKKMNHFDLQTKIDSAVPCRYVWSLEFVYGSSVLGKTDVFYGSDPFTLIYASASIGVIHDTRVRSQSFMQLHGSHAITAMAMHPSGNIVASGDIVNQSDRNAYPLLVLWDSRTGCEIVTSSILPDQYPSIQLARFSSQGDRLATIGLDPDHTMVIYEVANLPEHVRSGKENSYDFREVMRNESCITQPLLRHISTVKTSKQTICGLDFAHDNRLLTCGKNHLLFHQQRREKNGIIRIASIGANLNSHPSCKADITVYAAVYFTTLTQGSSSSVIISAQSDGSLYVWRSTECMDVRLRAHDGSIRAVCVTKERKQHNRIRNLLYTLGDDHVLNVWNERLEKIGAVQIDTYTAAFNYHDIINTKANNPKDHALMLHKHSKFKSICASNDRVLISTNQGEIFEILDLCLDSNDQKQRERTNGRVIFHVRGHFENLMSSGREAGTFRGIASHPNKLRFASTSEDGNIQVWDAPSHSLLFHHSLYSDYASKSPQVLVYSPDGKYILVGCTEGELLLFDEQLRQMKHEKIAGRKPISTMQYSDSGDLLAVGNTEGVIYLFDGITYSTRGQLYHSACILTHLHFTDTNQGLLLRSLSNVSNVFFEWNMATRELIRSFRCNAYEFLSLQEPKHPALPEIDIGNSIVSLCYNKERQLLAMCLEDCSVHLLGLNHYRDTLIGHYSDVTGIIFLCDDATLLTIGGSDFSIFQYKYH